MTAAELHAKLKRIEDVIQKTRDRKTLRLLNRDWWKTFFEIMKAELLERLKEGT